MNKPHRPEGDGYAVEVSLLKLRPPVLVLAAVSFVALVALLSWLGGGHAPLAASKGAANHAANQERRVEPPALPNSATSGQARDEDKRAASSDASSAASSDAVPGPSPAGFAESAAQSDTPAATPPAPEVTNNVAANPDIQSAPAPAVTSGGGYAVQAGSFPTVSEANACVSALRAAGFEARAAAVEIPKRGTWYRVYSGRFASREEAAAHDKKLRASGAVSATIITAVQD